jgi:hypothetical protein
VRWTASIFNRGEPGRSSRWLHLLTAALFLFAALYRFNALGGALGGFDNDHFLHFAYAKQVQAGAQPLRDFLDGGLQGARPSLTYEMSAWAQRLLGNSLRSEALLTVGAMAFASAATFAAARRVAPAYWALATSVLAILVAPKLYGYPKVLTLAVLAWLIVRYAALPAPLRLAALAAWTAVAFLFRHDYAVYCGVAVGVTVAAAHGRAWRRASGQAAIYLAVTLALVTPSLWWVHAHGGLRPYFENGLAMGERESARTSIDWPAMVFEPGWSIGGLLAQEQNAEAWLYYLFAAVPLLALVVVARLWWRRQLDATGTAVLALAAMTLVLFPIFLRGNLGARFGDLAPPVAIIAAWLLGRAAMPGVPPRSMLSQVATTAIGVVLLVATTVAVSGLGSVPHELEQTGLSQSPRVVLRQALRNYGELAGLPAAVWTDPAPQFSMKAAQYLHECTDQADLVLVATYAPEILAFADRRFAGGRATIIPGFYPDETHGALTLARLDAAPPLIALVEDDYLNEFPRLREFLAGYADAGMLTVDSAREVRILTHPGRTVVKTSALTGAPCFR